jgi:hypothetical protein
MFCAPGACLGLGCRLPLFAAVSAESDLNTLAPPLKGSMCGSHRPRILHPAIVAPRNFGGEVNPFRVRLYSAGVRETSSQGAGPPVGGPIGALSTTRHETHTSLTKCDNGPSRSRFKGHALTRLSSRGSEVGSCQLIEGSSAVWPNSHAQAGAAARQGTRPQHGLESHPPCIVTTDGQSPFSPVPREAPLCDPPALLLNRVRMR